MYQVVFSDVDGTLLNDQHCITPLTLLAIKKIQQQGIPFVIVSARSPSGIYPILKENNLVCPMICYGGGMILNHENEIILTTKEYDLLVYFITNKGLAISREQVLNKVWDENYYGSDRVVDDTLRRLRKKMPEINVRTIYGFGYRLD